MATIDKRVTSNGRVTYRARARLKGYPPQIASFARKTDATKWASSVESALREGRHFQLSEAKRHTLAQLVERYLKEVLPTKPKNAQNQRNQLLWWSAQLGYSSLADITPAKLAEYRDRLLNIPNAKGRLRSPATVVRYLAVLSHAFTVAMKEWGWTSDNPLRRVSKPKEPRGRVRYLDDDERTRLFDACTKSKDPLLYPIVLLAISTGMRRGEIINLRWRDVDLAKHMLVLHETKNGERRAATLAGRALEETVRLSKSKHENADFVFPSANGARPIDFVKAWKTALREAKIDDFRFHDLRHTAASYLAQGGATSLDIAAVLGHKTLAMVKRYAHLSDSRVAHVVRDMNERALGSAPMLD